MDESVYYLWSHMEFLSIAHTYLTDITPKLD